jgi:hypothetical protein
MIKSNLQAYRRQLEEQLALVDEVLRNFDRIAGVSSDLFEPAIGAGVSPLRSVPNPFQPQAVPNARKQTRVRGVLAAVREIIEELAGPFDKNDLLTRLKDKDADLADNISPANMRNTLRILTRQNVIQVQTEATSTKCARYIVTRTAAA